MATRNLLGSHYEPTHDIKDICIASGCVSCVNIQPAKELTSDCVAGADGGSDSTTALNMYK